MCHAPDIPETRPDATSSAQCYYKQATSRRSARIGQLPHDVRTGMLTTNPYDDDKLREECGVFGVSAT
ncbi:MAG: hypothetical protein EOP67_68635, partial [Sphingomonas sp.]